jgi:hypothetical protein
MADPNASWTDPTTGWWYSGNWSAPTAGNDQNAASDAQFLGSIYGTGGQTVADDSPLALYGSNGQFQGEGKTGVHRDIGDTLGLLAAATVLGGGIGNAFGAFGNGAGFAGDPTALGYDPGAFATGGVDTATMGAGAGGGASAYANPYAAGFTDTGTASGALDAGYAGSGALTGTAGMASPAAGGSFLSNVLPNGTGSLLGPAATLLGAASGAKGQEANSSSTRDIPDWLKPFVTGQGGLLPAAQNQFQQQIANPQGWQQISNQGLGLLSQPVAGNGYATFAAMPRFGR